MVEYAEADVFAPLKNAPGAERDTPEYVQRFMIAQHRQWLEAAGTRVAEGVAVEISPLWALDAEGVAARADRPNQSKSDLFADRLRINHEDTKDTKSVFFGYPCVLRASW